MHPRFTAHPTGVLRASALAGRQDLPPWPGGPANSSDHRDAWIAWLDQIRDHPVLGAAISDASPSLMQRIERVCREGGNGREVARVARSCARYVLRAQSRAAPFGWFAGVTATRFVSAVSGRLGDRHRPVARVETAWIRAAVDRLESCEAEFTTRLMVVVNDLAALRGERIIVEHQPEPGAERGRRSSLRLTAPARVALETARTPTPWSKVEAALHAEFPGRRDAVRALVGTLVRHRVLLTCLHPPMDTADPLGHLITAARGAGADHYPHAAAVLARLEAAHQGLRDHDAASDPGARAAAMGQARTALASVAPADEPTRVDLRLEGDLELPRTIAWQLQEAVWVLARLVPAHDGTPAWRDYHRRFCERYGIGAVVPVTELADPDRGLGLPAGFHGSRLCAPPAEALSERDAALLDLAHRATLDGTGEVVVDDAILERLGATPPDTVWPHTELRVRVHATSREALNAGAFRVVVAGVSRGAGTTVGRFLDLLPPPGRDALSALYRHLPTLRQDAILAQLSCPAASARGDQVSRTPTVLPTRLALGQHHPADPRALGLDDLAVTADPRHLHLVTRRDLRPVEPVVFSAIEFTRAAHPLLRFLAELPWSRTTVPVPFSWGAATHLPVLPRVRWQQCVLAPARWRLDAHALPGPRAPWREWVEGLRRWRTAYRIPDRVEMGENDQRLLLDLDKPAHQDLVRAGLDRKGQVFLREAPTGEDLGWLDGRAHEIVATLTADQTPIPCRSRPGSAHPHAVEHLPGGRGWCSVKLYGHPDHATSLITDELPHLTANEIPQAWFLRYRDPDPHLRLRVRVDEPGQPQAVHAWARGLRARGLVAAVVHDTYTPESGRFGPGAAMEAAEALFVADSRAVAAQLAADPTEGGMRVWAAVSMADLVHHFFQDAPAARRWLITHAPPGATDRAEAARTIGLTDPGYQGLPGPLQDAWSRRAEAVRAYAKALADLSVSVEDVLADLLHLHATRLFGPDPEAERACLALARAAALSWNARARGTR